jgi:iron only hydrogenase large subunit-like protein
MSAILSADDLNDFISPGVACIKPVETLPAAPPPTENPYEVTTEDKLPPSDLPPAQISLTDCLACSGCVTSAEAVLVSLQSHSEVLHALDTAASLNLQEEGSAEEGKIFVASVSPQTRASIAATYGVSERQAGYMIEQLLSGPDGLRRAGKYNNGFEWVVDTNVARDACLVLGAEEVMASMTGTGEPAKPILTSSCPGWICYAEKTHPHVLPHLSRLKSPQALMGTLIKTTLSRKLGIAPDRIWHVAVMPCFDKKLEASREELTDAYWTENKTENGGKGVRDVDCVITSKELLMLADSRGIDFSTLPRTPLPSTSKALFPDEVLQRFLFPSKPSQNVSDPAAGTSGGNLFHILQSFSARNPGSMIETVRGRNADVVEYSVVSSSGQVLMKAARYYGFRNIQNLVRRLKPAKPSRMPGGRPVGGARRPGGKPAGPDYAYVEVMACPGGCTNGGGQIKVDDPVVSGAMAEEVKPGPQEQKAWLAQVDEAYYSGSESDTEGDNGAEDDILDTINGISPSHIKDTLAHWAYIANIDLDRLAYTSYRAVVSDVGKDKVGDTERVVELAGKIGGGW